jgi:hypothetical protein
MQSKHACHVRDDRVRPQGRVLLRDTSAGLVATGHSAQQSAARRSTGEPNGQQRRLLRLADAGVMAATIGLRSKHL